jgi:hypothetical protein
MNGLSNPGWRRKVPMRSRMRLAAPRQRRRRRFPQDLSAALDQVDVGAGLFCQLEEECRVVVLGEQPPEQAAGGGERRRIRVPAQLEQPPIRRNGPHGRRGAKHGARHRQRPVPPGAIRVLMEQQLPTLPRGIGNALDFCLDLQPEPCDLGQGAILHRRRATF